MDAREALCALWLCGSLAFTVECEAYFTGLAMTSLATVLLLRCQLTSRLAVSGIGGGPVAKPLYPVRPLPRMAGVERRQAG